MSLQDGKRSPGQKLFRVPASKWNNAIDAGDAWAAGLLGQPGSPSTNFSSADTVKVKNETGSDLERGSVICLDDFALDDLDAAMIWFTGQLPTTDELPYGILLNPLPDGEFGAARVNGVCLAKINKVYDDHPFAHIAAGESQLQTDWHGQAEILFKKEVEGQWWAVVRLGNYQSVELKGVVSESGGIAATNSGDVDIEFKGALTSPLQTLTAFYDHMADGTASEDADVLIRYFRDEARWEIVELDCS